MVEPSCIHDNSDSQARRIKTMDPSRIDRWYRPSHETINILLRRGIIPFIFTFSFYSKVAKLKMDRGGRTRLLRPNFSSHLLECNKQLANDRFLSSLSRLFWRRRTYQ